MTQMTVALTVLVAGGLWYSGRNMKKLLKGEAASLIGAGTYAVLLLIGLIIALLWA